MYVYHPNHQRLVLDSVFVMTNLSMRHSILPSLYNTLNISTHEETNVWSFQFRIVPTEGLERKSSPVHGDFSFTQLKGTEHWDTIIVALLLKASTTSIFTTNIVSMWLFDEDLFWSPFMNLQFTLLYHGDGALG